MNPTLSTAPGHHLRSASGLQARLFADGGVQRLDCHGVMLNLFVGNALEGGPTNLWLRRLDGNAVQAVPLLGPLSPLRAAPMGAGAHTFTASGTWQGIQARLQLRLAASTAAWFWHLDLLNTTGVAQKIVHWLQGVQASATNAP